MTDRQEHVVMILRGSAGTGKTTLAAAIVKALARLQQKLVLLAPTGRAAKVFSLYAGHPAYTIHRRIYRQKSAGSLSAFTLNDNLNRKLIVLLVPAGDLGVRGEGEVGLALRADKPELIDLVLDRETLIDRRSGTDQIPEKHREIPFPEQEKGSLHHQREGADPYGGVGGFLFNRRIQLTHPASPFQTIQNILSNVCGFGKQNKKRRIIHPTF